MFDKDEPCGVAILTGYGRNFCAGYDLKELATADSSAIIIGQFGEGPSPMV